MTEFKSIRAQNDESIAAQLEVLDRLNAVDVVIEAIQQGHWTIEPDVLDALEGVLAAATRWAERAEAA